MIANIVLITAAIVVLIAIFKIKFSQENLAQEKK